MIVAESRDGDCTNAEYFSRKHKGDFEKSVCADITEISFAVPDMNTEGFDDVGFQDSGPAIQLDKDKFLTNVALFYLRMQSKMILPATTIQILIDEFMDVHTNSMTCQIRLRSPFSKKHLNYVEPVQVYLGCDASGKERYCQYIPVKETLN